MATTATIVPMAAPPDEPPPAVDPVPVRGRDAWADSTCTEGPDVVVEVATGEPAAVDTGAVEDDPEGGLAAPP
jgi:hypothetical protein